MAAVIEAKRLSFSYPGSESPVVRDLSLTVGKGEFVAIIGGSGVGKSTLLRAIAGLLRPEVGEVALSQVPKPGTRRRAMVFQDARLLPWRTVEGNVLYGLESLGLSEEEKLNRARGALSLTRLSEYAERWPHQLSGGQIQRVGIARALAVEPSVLLMDEPFSAVDAITRIHLQDELLRIWQASKKAIIFVTHDIQEAAHLADRVLVMEGNPATVKGEVAVSAKRPRNRLDPAIQETARRISAFLAQ